MDAELGKFSGCPSHCAITLSRSRKLENCVGGTSSLSLSSDSDVGELLKRSTCDPRVRLSASGSSSLHHCAPSGSSGCSRCVSDTTPSRIGGTVLGPRNTRLHQALTPVQQPIVLSTAMSNKFGAEPAAGLTAAAPRAFPPALPATQ